MKTTKIQLLALTLCCISLGSCGSKTVDDSDQQGEFSQTFLSSIESVKVVSELRKETLTLTGQVEYDSDRVINYSPLVGGTVGRVYFSLGDKVQKGQKLLDIQSTELSELQSEQSSLLAEIGVLERELKSAHELFDDSMLSEKELMEAESKLKQLQAALAKTKADMQLFGSNKGNGVFSLTAPMTGYIVSKNISSGSTISAEGDPIFTIADLSTVWVMLNVYASNLQLVKEGMDVSFTTLSYPDEVFEGKISFLSHVFDPEDKVLKARIVISNKDLKLKPGMSAVVNLKKDSNTRYAAIPTDALIFDNNKYYVVVKDIAGNFQSRKVSLAGHNEKYTYVQTGLSEGEEVVVSNQLLIHTKLNQR